MFYVYILRSIKFGKFYIGHTSDLEKRINDHNRDKVRSTKSYLPRSLVLKEDYSTKSEAYKIEMQIKSYKSGDAFKRLLDNQ